MLCYYRTVTVCNSDYTGTSVTDFHTELSLMFDESTYTVVEGGMVEVVVELCGTIMDDVVVSTLTTNDGSAGMAQPFHNVDTCTF